jgi:hypothetical protein
MPSPLTLPTPAGYKLTATRQDLVATLLAALGPTGTKQLKTVTDRIQVRAEADLRKVVHRNKLPATFVIEALGDHPIGRSSSIIRYSAPSKHHILDLRINLISILAFKPTSESPDELVATLEEAMLASILVDGLRGGNALFTEPMGRAHTSYLFGDRVMHRLSIGCPILFRRPVP